MSHIKRQQLQAKIEKAFKNTTPPPAHKMGDPYEVSDFHGKRWQDVSLEAIRSTYNIFFFSSEGLHYFIPAYVIAILRDYDQLRGYAVVDSVLRFLGEFDTVYPQKTPLKKLFSTQQIQVILEFLEDFETMFPWPELENKNEQIALDRQKANRQEFIERAVQYWNKSS